MLYSKCELQAVDSSLTTALKELRSRELEFREGIKKGKGLAMQQLRTGKSWPGRARLGSLWQYPSCDGRCGGETRSWSRGNHLLFYHSSQE